MLSGRAYTFRQQSKLAVSLSWVGGYVNLVLVVGCGEYVSHMSGNTSRFAQAIGDGDSITLLRIGALLCCFWLGAVTSGIMTESARQRGWHSRYLRPMALQGALLSALAVMFAFRLAPVVPLALASMAAFTMGLQNATITEISGAVIRTTHVTGVITDLGTEFVRIARWWIDGLHKRRAARIGRMFRVSSHQPATQRFSLLFCVFWSFVIGAAWGAWMGAHHLSLALLPPVAFIAALIVLDLRWPIAGIEELDLLADPHLPAAGITRSLLPRGMGLYRLTHYRHDALHRPPDLVAWIERVPAKWRVIILSIGPMTQLTENAAVALREGVEKLRERRRDLVLCGATPAQYRMLQRCGLFDVLAAQNVCPDIEFAIARGVELLRRYEGLHSTQDLLSMT